MKQQKENIDIIYFDKVTGTYKSKRHYSTEYINKKTALQIITSMVIVTQENN